METDYEMSVESRDGGRIIGKAVIMSRSVLLVSLLLFLVFTSQFEWNQHIVNEVEARPLEEDVSRRNKDYVLQREESVKEKVRSFVRSVNVSAYGLFGFRLMLHNLTYCGLF
ncbi:hypothetical protein Tco_0335706 [Tanacetum coccineum]